MATRQGSQEAMATAGTALRDWRRRAPPVMMVVVVLDIVERMDPECAEPGLEGADPGWDGTTGSRRHVTQPVEGSGCVAQPARRLHAHVSEPNMAPQLLPRHLLALDRSRWRPPQTMSESNALPPPWSLGRLPRGGLYGGSKWSDG